MSEAGYTASQSASEPNTLRISGEEKCASLFIFVFHSVQDRGVNFCMKLYQIHFDTGRGKALLSFNREAKLQALSEISTKQELWPMICCYKQAR